MAAIEGAYARLTDLLALRDRRRASIVAPHTSSQAGYRFARVKGRGVDFAEVRLYQPGDDIRTIDWHVTARKAKPHTKIFREERERPTLIVVDQTQSMFFGSQRRLKSVLAAELASRIAWQALSANDRVGGIVLDNHTTHVFKPFRSAQAVARLLRAIADANAALTRETHVDESELWSLVPDQLARLARVNHRVVVISDFSLADGAGLEDLGRISRHNQVELFFVYDPLERSLPPANQYSVTDGTRRHEFDSGRSALRHQYTGRFEARLASVERQAYRTGMRFFSITTRDDVDQSLAGLLR